MAKLKIQTASGSSTQRDAYVSPTLINSNHIGGVGGDTALAVPTIRCSFLRDSGGAVQTGGDPLKNIAARVASTSAGRAVGGAH